MIDSAVRFLLDLPTIKIRNHFINSLKVLNKYSIIFGMSLQEQLNKEYFQMKSKKPLTDYDFLYLANIGSLIQKMSTARYNEAHDEFISSLIFPYLTFTFSLVTPDAPLPV